MLKESFQDLVPIIAVIAFFQIVILQSVPENIWTLVGGFIIVGLGLSFFIRGLEAGIFPLGEALAEEFAKKKIFIWLLIFSFLIGFSTTIAEPALTAIAEKAEVISHGRIDAFALRMIVALSVGAAITVGVLRIILGHPIHYYIITGYLLVIGTTFLAPQEIVGLAYDSGGITTSTVTVPLIAALGVGLASNIKGRNPMIDGFGLIAFASLTPMIFVQLYGAYEYSFGAEHALSALIESAPIAQETTSVVIQKILEFGEIIRNILPIFAVIFFFQYFVIRKKLPDIKSIGKGIVLVVLGLYAFMIGLEIGLFPIGESMAAQLTAMDNTVLIYLFGFAIGFATTMAEPALIAIAWEVNKVSKGKIKSLLLRIFVALGVALGIALGCYRIVQGDSFFLYIVSGYAVVIFLTFFAPKYIIPIAYDSGGVTTSTVTVPIVAALGLGLAMNIEGRNPMIDGFGLIAFASLFPMITVMGYGILSEFLRKKTSSSL